MFYKLMFRLLEGKVKVRKRCKKWLNTEKSIGDFKHETGVLIDNFLNVIQNHSLSPT